ncbi:MAG TPA: phosphate ABC transporter substrate-binding protein PstS [Candidatus Thermoplasmatota archaeon]|nr:phosphate ABC transporter substrate-binding protein PstS [Candidatus Thermoplasmatota archaeon]
MKHILATATIAALLLAGCSGSTGMDADGDDAFGPNPYAPPTRSTDVLGSGATFPKPLIETWALTYNQQQPTVKVSYAGGGSGKGISDITQKQVVFAASDAPLSDSEKAAAPGILQFPDTLGLVAIAYNQPSVPDGLRLDGETLGKVFTGAISRWDDPAIAALNPGAQLPDERIAIVYRSDSSGTTFVFTDYLAKASQTWSGQMGAGASKKPDWTKSTAQQLSGNGNDGVGSTIRSTPNSIGYVELAFVKSLGLKSAHIQNKAGGFVAPTTDGATKAASAAAASLPAPDGDWSDVSIVDSSAPGAYPISSFSYVLVYKDLATYGGAADAQKLQAFRAWMWWSLHHGQRFAEPLGYAPLPAEVAAIGVRALEGMQVGA